MKKYLVTALAMFSFSAFSAVELTAKIDRVSCVIKDNKVSRTQTFGKDQIVGLTQVNDISLTGIEDALRMAENSARPSTEQDPEFVFNATLDGRQFPLNMKDSKEALTVIQVIVKACR